MAAAGTDIKYLLSSEEVPEALQAQLFHSGVTSVARFAALTDSVADLRALLAVELNLDAAAGMAARVNISKFVVAWTKASARLTKSAELEGEHDAKRMLKPLSTTDYATMRQAYQTRWWVLEDRQVPSRSYLEKKLESVEQDEPRAERLAQVTNRDEDDAEVLHPVWTAQGTMELKRGTPTVAEPTNPEQLRKRLQLLGVAWAFCAFRHTNRPWLAGLTPQLWLDYAEYLLGEHVHGLVAKDSHGRTLMTPAWTHVLAYDLAIRKECCRRVVAGEGTLEACLRAAWRDPVTKERHFTTPVALSAIPQAVHNATDAPRSNKRPPPAPLERTAKKAKGKGKGKQTKGSVRSNKAQLQGCASHDPSGKPICFRYNLQDEPCTSRQCRFRHCCGICFGSHPMWRCQGADHAPIGETK